MNEYTKFKRIINQREMKGSKEKQTKETSQIDSTRNENTIKKQESQQRYKKDTRQITSIKEKKVKAQLQHPQPAAVPHPKRVRCPSAEHEKDESRPSL